MIPDKIRSCAIKPTAIKPINEFTKDLMFTFRKQSLGLSGLSIGRVSTEPRSTSRFDSKKKERGS